MEKDALDPGVITPDRREADLRRSPAKLVVEAPAVATPDGTNGGLRPRRLSASLNGSKTSCMCSCRGAPVASSTVEGGEAGACTETL